MRVEARGDGEPQPASGTGDQNDTFAVRHFVEP
jgi:hypothetical protein